jgi:hypothetical protein
VVPGPAPNDWWQRRDRRFFGATIGLGVVTAASALTSGMFAIAADQHRGPAGFRDDGMFVARRLAIITGVATLAVGTAWGIVRARGWRPEPTPDPDDWWYRRDRKLRAATITLGTITGATALTSMIAAGVRDRDYGDAFSAMLGTAVVSGVASITTIALGATWGLHRAQRWEPKYDPRRVPQWVVRDRRLRRGTIATGVMFGGFTVGAIITFAALFASYDAQCDSGHCSDGAGYALGASILGFGVPLSVLAGASGIAFAGVGGAWIAHRLPLRRWQARLAPGGLRIDF